MMVELRICGGLGILLGANSMVVGAAMLEEMEQRLEQQQVQIESLQRQLEETDNKVEATAEAIESGGMDSGERWTERPRISGYGELHYNNLDNGNPDGSDKKEIDFHRFVLNFDYDFTDRIRFYSEVELEHSLAGEGKEGEIELEQAYLDFDFDERHTARGGLFLIPVGILNETHEPPTFYGVERNPIENKIIPTTWWEGGAGLHGRFGQGWHYDVALHSGLKVTAGNDFAIRSGRQKVSEAAAEDLATTGRIRWTGKPGIELAATLQYQSDIAQGEEPGVDDAILVETHAVIERGPFGLRALYAMWDLNGSSPEAIGADEQMGWYIEPSYRFMPEVGVFVRYSEWDNTAGSGADSEFGQFDIGLNYWPHPNVVVKADYQVQDAPSGEDEFDGFNLGIGYQF